MIRNDLFLLFPPNECDDLKKLVAFIVDRGVGRPAISADNAVGAWTPDLLAEKIFTIDSRGKGVDVRSIYLWIEDNGRGIGSRNINLLAEVASCGDEAAFRAWRSALTKANLKLKQRPSASRPKIKNLDKNPTLDVHKNLELERWTHDELQNTKWLTRLTHKIYMHEFRAYPSILVVGLACCLLMLSFSLGNHSYIFEEDGHGARQIGFFWSINWSLVFLFLFPIYVSRVSILLDICLNQANSNPIAEKSFFMKASATYSLFFFSTVVIASLGNWTWAYFSPVVFDQIGDWPVDWARISLYETSPISKTEALFFSGIVFLYNGLCSYLYFIGLTYVWLISSSVANFSTDLNGKRIECEVCVIVTFGMLIMIAMKLQSASTLAFSFNVIQFVIEDAKALLDPNTIGEKTNGVRLKAPGHTYSFFCLLYALVVYFISSRRIRRTWKAERVLNWARVLNDSTIATLALTYFSIGWVEGFSVLVGVSIFIACCQLLVVFSKLGGFSNVQTQHE
jgi:hypothetical protein